MKRLMEEILGKLVELIKELAPPDQRIKVPVVIKQPGQPRRRR